MPGEVRAEPEWEAVFEPHSYGFRPGRAVQDAAVAVKHGLGAEGAGRKNQRSRCRWVLDADIKSFFDEISHDAILSHVPVFREVIAGWLKAGVFTGECSTPRTRGRRKAGSSRRYWPTSPCTGWKTCSTSGR